jgi:putative nucleotidyltransferase with HDIG domain
MMELSYMVEKSRDLAALPSSVVKLAAVIADPQSAIGDVAEAIRFDQALTASVLREANSVASASRRTISTVKDAVVRLGGARILSHCIATALKNRFVEALPGYGYAEQDLWRHSVAAAVAAEELGAAVKTTDHGLAFTAALLHDIGKLIMGRMAPAADMQSVWDSVKRDNLTCERAETEVFGFSHAILGAEMVKEWALPEPIELAVRHHHAAAVASEPCTDSVVIANIVAHAIGVGLGYEGMGVTVDDAVAQRLDLTHQAFEKLCANTAYTYQNVTDMFER